MPNAHTEHTFRFIFVGTADEMNRTILFLTGQSNARVWMWQGYYTRYGYDSSIILDVKIKIPNFASTPDKAVVRFRRWIHAVT